MQRRQTKALRLTFAAAAGVFLFFLIKLTPHRVHHMFDENAENTCVAFTLSKGCALSALSAPYVASFAEYLHLSSALFLRWPLWAPKTFFARGPNS